MTGENIFAGMGPGTWDELAGSNFYSSSIWLRHCASYPDAVCGAVAHSVDNRTAAVPVAHFTSPPPANYHWSGILGRYGLPAPPPVGTLVGPRQGYQTHLLRTTRAETVTGGDDTPPAGGEAVVAGLVEAVRQAAARRRPAHPDAAYHAGAEAKSSPCVAMYLTTADVTRLRAAGVDTLPVLLEPDAWMEVPAGGWDAWLASLPSRRRVRIRQEARRFLEAGCRISHRPLAHCQESLVPASVSMAKKYGLDQGPEYFRGELERYIRYTGDAARVAVCTRNDDEPLGFCVYYIWGDTLFLRWASFNHSLLTGNAEYFNVSYYSQIQLAGTLGLRWLHAGKKAIEAKVLRGATLRPLWLLDLSADSVLGGRCDEIRQHNARLLAALESDSRTARAIADRADWDIYC